jgi:hypothetical protein
MCGHGLARVCAPTSAAPSPITSSCGSWRPSCRLSRPCKGNRSTHHRCADLYERHGVDLAALPRVGVGSICRRQASGEVEQIVRSLAGRGLRLHTFGAKVLGLARYADAICSSDSLAWSFRGRHVPGCSPSHRSESNCVHFALAWHTRLLASLPVDTSDRPNPRPPVTSSPATRSTRTRGRGPRQHRASAPVRPATRTRRERSTTSSSPPATAV